MNDFFPPTVAGRTRQRHANAEMEKLISCDIVAAQKMRTILQDAAAQISRLHFECGCPIVGYDIPDVLATLRDCMPACDIAMESRIAYRACERVAELDMQEAA